MNLRRDKDMVYVDLEGEISFTTSAELKKTIHDFIKPSDSAVIINMSKVDFVDSAGLGTLISILKRIKRQKGRLILEYPQLGVQKLLEMTQIDKLMEVKKTQEPTTGDWSDFEKA